MAWSAAVPGGPWIEPGSAAVPGRPHGLSPPRERESIPSVANPIWPKEVDMKTVFRYPPNRRQLPGQALMFPPTAVLLTIS